MTTGIASEESSSVRYVNLFCQVSVGRDITCWFPAPNKYGNSVRGIHFCQVRVQCKLTESGESVSVRYVNLFCQVRDYSQPITKHEAGVCLY